jgi:cephalosporin hydroxylase
MDVRLDRRLRARSKTAFRQILGQAMIDQVHRWLYHDETWVQTQWLGVSCQKYPIDLWLYQEIIYATRPTLIIETGTAQGGSALFLASILDLIGEPGRVISIDIAENAVVPSHPRICFLTGRSSTAADLVQQVSREAKSERTMVILDSDHSARHVLEELSAYSTMVSPGCFLVVEDTNVNGHPVFAKHGPGPMEALEEWLPQNRQFHRTQWDRRYFISQNPLGYLERR